MHLNCMRGNVSWCLDWREICDGKVDCWPKLTDENYCEQLERNECNSDEYRCRNGQCIPESFVFDDPHGADCLDSTDENIYSLSMSSYLHMCANKDPTFRCTDVTCQHWSFRSCSNHYCSSVGSCRQKHNENFDLSLLLRTLNNHLNYECWVTMICLVLFGTRMISEVRMTF